MMTVTRRDWILLGLVLCSLTSGCKSSSEGGGGETEMGGAGGAPPETSGGVIGIACDDDEQCDDGIYCNGEESCDGGICTTGERVACDDGISCTLDSCIESTRQCRSVAPDVDGDGHADASCLDDEGEPLGDDCDDEDALSFPGNVEICDPHMRDEDCDPKTIGNRDSDRDGYVDEACCNEQSNGSMLCGEDCDDRKTNVNPAATEACDFLDNNCDGETDEGVSIQMYRDRDHDGRGDEEAGRVRTCPLAVGFSAIGEDCDDNDPEVFLNQFEICDDKDNNCDGNVDEIQQLAPWYRDEDGDGYGDAESTPVLSCYRVPGRVLSQNDCNDSNNKINPNATEICDGADNDCNGLADFKLSGTNNFEDDDLDGVADADCGGDDCDDTDPRTAEGAEEVCDRIDNDCDGEVDEQTVQNIWYVDEDGDGWGVVLGSALASCDPISDRATNFGDCDDTDSTSHPGMVESCDGIDEDCDGIVDEGASVHCHLDNAIPTCKAGACQIFSCVPGFVDTDEDPSNGCEDVSTVDPDTGIPCVGDGACQNGNICDGVETCFEGTCRLGTPINCSAAPTVIQGDFSLNNGQDLLDLDGIELITGDLVISATNLTTLIGLESLKTVGGNLFVQGNVQLKRLSGSALSNLEVVGGDVVVTDNAALTNVDLPSLVTARSLFINNNDALEVVGKYESLASVSELIQISDNDALTRIIGFDLLSRIGGAYDSTYQETGSCSGGGMIFHSNPLLEDIAAFPALREVGGDFCLSSYLGDFLDLPSLREVGMNAEFYQFSIEQFVLPQLRSVGMNFRIDQVEAISSLTEVDLPKLRTVGFLSIQTGGALLEKVSAPELETAEAIEFYVYDDETNFEEFDFASLTQVSNIYLSIYAGGLPLDHLVFPELKSVTSQLYVNIDTTGLETIEFPLLESAQDIDMDVTADDVQKISFESLSDVGASALFYLSTTSLGELDLSQLNTVGQSITVNADPTAFDIGSLVSVGDEEVAGSIELCTGSFFVCDEVTRIYSEGFPGYIETCGQCDQL